MHDIFIWNNPREYVEAYLDLFIRISLRPGLPWLRFKTRIARLDILFTFILFNYDRLGILIACNRSSVPYGPSQTLQVKFSRLLQFARLTRIFLLSEIDRCFKIEKYDTALCAGNIASYSFISLLISLVFVLK